MFGMGFDLVLSGILLVLVVVFLMGKGEGILRAFSGSNYKKRDRETQLRLERSCAVFCAVLMAAELAMAFLQNVWRPVGIVYIVVILADMVIFSFYFKKNFD